MTQEEKLTALMHSRIVSFKRRVNEAKRIIETAFQQNDQATWYCAVSGGKDSQVVFDLLPADIPGIFSDDAYWLPETEEFLRHLQTIRDVRWIRTTAVHTAWFQIQGDYDGIPDYARQQGWQGVFLGLRQQENNRRKRHLRKYGTLFFAKNYQMWHCNPLSHWTVWDVWAYIISHELQYNRAYDVLARLGVPIEQRRIGPFATSRALAQGQLAILKQGWPEQYNRFVKDHPEAARFI